MPVQEFHHILSDLKKGDFKPLYFLHGQEPYFIDTISDFIEKNALSEAEKSFNQSIFYGKDSSPIAIRDTASRYPMMASRQVILLKEAQDMKELAQLKSYIEKPVETTVLVICHKYKKYNFNSGFGKAVRKQAVVMEAKRMYDNKLPGWIEQYLKSSGLRITPAATQLLSEYLGTNLSKVANELDKLAINLPKGTQISQQHIEEHIGISKDYNVFELQRALGERSVLKANRIVKYFTADLRKHPLVMVVGALYNYFSKVYMLHALQNESEKEVLKALRLGSSYFLREYRLAARNYPRLRAEKVISILREYDLKSKGINYHTSTTSDAGLMKEMVWKILHT